MLTSQEKQTYWNIYRKIHNLPNLKQVRIGTQVWSSRNLDVNHYRNGDEIPLVTNNEQWENLTTGARCYPNGDKPLVEKYGYLYNWYAVNDERGLAPEGWHVPTDEEWQQLEDFLGKDGGTKLKSKSGWPEDGNGTDDYGFAGLPAGYRSTNGNYNIMGYDAFFWSATEGNSTNAWYRYLNYNDTTFSRYYSSKGSGFSVRCVRD